MMIDQIHSGPVPERDLLSPEDLDVLKEQLKKLVLFPDRSYTAGEIESRISLPLFKKLLEQADTVAFGLHRQEKTYQKAFFQEYRPLILSAYRILALQVNLRLERAMSQRIRSGVIREQIAREKEELSRIEKESQEVQEWNPEDPWSLQAFFHFKGCFYHVCTACQKILLALEEGGFTAPMVKEAGLVTGFYQDWLSLHQKGKI